VDEDKSNSNERKAARGRIHAPQKKDFNRNSLVSLTSQSSLLAGVRAAADMS
jgi:hypothetical protein